MSLILRNPHSVFLALEKRPEDVREILLPGGKAQGAWQEVVRIAEKKKIPIRAQSLRRDKSSKGRERTGFKDGRLGETQPSALVVPKTGVPLGDLWGNKDLKVSDRGLWLALDSIQDPHNVGAIFRAAAFFGVKGIILPEDRACSLTSTVYDVACGGVETVPFSIQTNLVRSLQDAKEAGLWTLGSSEHADTDLATIEPDRPWVLVLGNEESGARRLVLENCDMVCQISPKGSVTSLNVSVAAGIFISKLA
jgi:23S rRNA (guanosine2251-2'-O)-methyltransferase